jgi:hypothetical protein
LSFISSISIEQASLKVSKRLEGALIADVQAVPNSSENKVGGLMMMLFGIVKARAAELVFLTIASDNDRTTVHVRVCDN